MTGSDEERRADRRARVLLELERARARRRAGGLTLRLPRSLPVPEGARVDREPAPLP